MSRRKYIIAKKNHKTIDGYTWSQGLIYEVIEGARAFYVTTNEGTLRYANEWKRKALQHFVEYRG